jgi:hypothetical protein
MRRTLLLALVAVSLVGCGSDGGEATPPPPSPTGATTVVPPTTTVVTVTAPEDTSDPRERPTGKPTFVVTLRGANATPTAGEPWRYTVTARARRGGSAGGTAKMRVFVGNELVDTIGFFAFDGTLTRTHRWPAVLKGQDGVVLQAEVEGDGGTQRVNFPVRVR